MNAQTATHAAQIESLQRLLVEKNAEIAEEREARAVAQATIQALQAEVEELRARMEVGRRGLLATLRDFGCAAPVEVTEGLFANPVKTTS